MVAEQHGTHESNAGLPVTEEQGAAEAMVEGPNHDELDRRDAEKARPRREAGPPLGEASSDFATEAASVEEPPPPTEPDEP